MSRAVETIWSLGFLSGELRSHPERLLTDHLRGVADLCEKIISIYRLPIDLDIAKTISYTHDLGKAHPKFQAYLDRKGPGVNHAESSSWFTYLSTRDFWAAEVVRRHHTNLRDINTLEANWMPDSVTFKNTDKMLREYLPSWPLHLTNEAWKELEDLFFEGLDTSILRWLTTRLMYSVLITADRMDAIGVEDFFTSETPSFLPPVYAQKGVLDEWRNSIRQQCIKSAEAVDSPGVYTLTLPTGAGKTLLGLEIANNWLNKFNYKTIIYALPYISIVEQNAEKAREVFGMKIQEDHSVSFHTKSQSVEATQLESNWEKMLVLYRYWREPVVITTMVQLWDTLFSAAANKSMNFHKLSQAVVILDEPQSIPPKFWRGLSDMLNYISESLGTIFLFMTATQPQIAAKKELSPPKVALPLERHRYLVKSGKYDFKDLQSLLTDNLPVTEGSGLIVLNTRRAAIRAYQTLKKMVGNAPVLFLSTWMTPWHRKRTLKLLRRMEAKKIKRYLVATQVVEAGVDLDFDWVFRDMGPLDSIVQVAGRCNRHLCKDRPGKVLVAELTSDGRSFAMQIYDDGITIPVTRQILPHDVEFGEIEANKLVKTYYETITNEGFISEPIFKNLSSGKWDNIPPLIQKDKDYEISVIVEQNSKVRTIYERLENNKWTLENRHQQKMLYRELQQYVINIPTADIPACRRKMEEIFTRDNIEPFAEVFGGTMFFMTRDGIRAGLYNRRIGFVPPGPTSSGSMFID